MPNRQELQAGDVVPVLCSLAGQLVHHRMALRKVRPGYHILQLCVIAEEVKERGLRRNGPAPDQAMATRLCLSGEDKVNAGDPIGGLEDAVRGLCFAPFDPALWYVAAAASDQLGYVNPSSRLLAMVNWIDPKYLKSLQDVTEVRPE